MTITTMIRALLIAGEPVQIYSHDRPDGYTDYYFSTLAQLLASKLPVDRTSLTMGGLTLEKHRILNQGMDEDYARATDLSKPIIFCPDCNGCNICIDGHHRVRKALLTGIDELPCVLLDPSMRAVLLVDPMELPASGIGVAT